MRRARLKPQGFTLIELLVVIVIIALLMAIAIPAYLSQQKKAKDSKAQQYLQHAYRNAVSPTEGANASFAAPVSLLADLSASEPELSFSNAAGCAGIAANATPNQVVIDTNSGNKALNLWNRSETGRLWHLTATPGYPPSVASPVSCGSFAAAVSVDTPTAYWRLGEGAGTVASDATAGGYNGTYSGSYSLKTAGLLTSDSDYGAIFSPGSTSLNGGGVSAAGLGGVLGGSNFSVESWVSYAAIPAGGSNQYLFVASRGWGSPGGWALDAYYATVCSCQRMQFVINDSGTQYSATWANATPGQLHLVGTYDGTTVKLYVNGAVVAQSAHAGATLTSAATLYLGQNLIANTVSSPIEIDEVALYPQALLQPAISSHYAAR